MENTKSKNKILFAVKLNNQKCYWLSLTPQNYQQQFKYFVKAANMNISQAEQLKRNIQNALIERVRQTEEHFKQQQMKIKQQQENWKKGKVEQFAYSQVVEQIPNSHKNQHNIKISKKDIQRQEQIQMGVQVQINHDLLDQAKHNINNIKLVQQNEKTQQTINKIHKTNISYENAIKNQDQNQQEQIYNSPRFNMINSKTDSHDSKMNTAIVHSEQQILPRIEIPIMHKSQNQNYNSIHKSTQANSPQHINKYVTPKNQKIQSIKQTPLDFSNKKPFFLENYALKLKTKDDQQNQSEQSYENKQKNKANKQTFNRLYLTQTASSKSKHIQQINTQQQINYNKMIQYMSKKRQPSIQYFQNMSIKTTQSYRAKFHPQPNLIEQKEQQQYQKSFQQHLKIKQLQKKRKQKIKQETSLSKPKIYKGSRCEANIIRQSFALQINQREQKERKLKEKIKSRKKLEMVDVSPKSPLRKSRVCPSCDNSPQHSPQPKPKIRKPVPLKKQNKAYVSNILNQSYKEFASQIKNFD